ncbi:MAG: cation:proton antiporter [Candidatus Roizmanbacteria bacterium]|nr:cation:proton antiporter [Candidatus Roizmanbacteria bacterium]
MGEISTPIVFSFFIYLFVPFIFGALAKKIKISPLIGYIIGGLVLGNFFPNLINNQAIKNFAYFGILLLLFTLGLEINFSRILNFKKIIITAGLLQIIISIILISLLSGLFRFNLLQSFLIGIALASSSTTLVAKIIQDRGEERSFIGEIAIGMLLFQNIAFIPFLIIFTSISGNNISPLAVTLDIFVSFAKSALIIAGLYYLGRKVIPWLFNRVARSSRELLNLFIILFIFFVTSLSLVLKIPTLIGVFIAGILLAQTLEYYHIFSEVRPLRDLLGVIFFVYIGSNIKLLTITGFLPQILLFTMGIILIKILVTLFVFLVLRFHSKTSLGLALYLFQVDEDAFILLSSALFNKVISYDKYLFVITSTLITLILTPIIIKNKNKIYESTRTFIKKYLPFLEKFIAYRIDSNQSPIDTLEIKNHVVICGYGRIGGYIGRSLMLSNIPYVAIDYNLYQVEKAKKQGVNIIYGDPTDINILDYAQVDEALILILALPERLAQEAVVLNARKLNRDIFIISRVHRQADQTRMKDLGANLVVQPEFEASLTIIKKIYLWHKMDKQDIINKIRRLKIEHGIS